MCGQGQGWRQRQGCADRGRADRRSWAHVSGSVFCLGTRACPWCSAGAPGSAASPSWSQIPSALPARPCRHASPRGARQHLLRHWDVPPAPCLVHGVEWQEGRSCVLWAWLTAGQAPQPSCHAGAGNTSSQLSPGDVEQPSHAPHAIYTRHTCPFSSLALNPCHRGYNAQCSGGTPVVPSGSSEPAPCSVGTSAHEHTAASDPSPFIY